MTGPRPQTRAARWRIAALLLLLSGLLLQGCATPPQTAALARQGLSELPSRALLEDVPFHPQEAYQCGPAALAMAMAPASVQVDPGALTEQLYLPDRLGSLQPELTATIRRHGLLAYPLAPELSAVLREVAAGSPVIVLQNLALPIHPVWHYAVVIGFDFDQRELILHSGPEARQRLAFSTFERTWARGDRWAVVASSPARLPATATADRWLGAALDLEQTGQSAAALAAYETALTRWPDNLTALIGRGNAAVALARYDTAAAAYRETTARHPDIGIAFNNLAWTLLQLGQFDAATAAARRAVELGGPHADAFAETLREIEQAQQ